MKTLKNCKGTYIIIYLFLSIFFVQISFAQIYVKKDASGLRTGNSWEDAFTDLQDALKVANDGDTIWVAKGIYKPTDCRLCGISQRKISFKIPSGVSVYGGFEGSESSLFERNSDHLLAFRTFLTDSLDEQRVDKQYLVERFGATIISGDIGENSDKDNSYHVIETEGDYVNLDALTIMDGNANGLSKNFRDIGAGIYINSLNIKLNSCNFLYNYAKNRGGGLYVKFNNVAITQCNFIQNTAKGGAGIHGQNNNITIRDSYFIQNSASGSGGGIQLNSDNDNIKPMIDSCRFIGNDANNAGGGMANFRANPIIINCLFEQNKALGRSGYGGGISSYFSNPIISDSYFTSNSAEAQGGGIGSKSSRLKINDCSLAENYANQGGGVSIFGGNGEISNCKFDKNLAANGGGVYNYRSSTRIYKSTFTSNQAKKSGGGIYSFKWKLEVVQCTFLRNLGKEKGGGVRINSSDSEVNKCVFYANYASEGYGGGLANKDCKANLINCTFGENSAALQGGGIYTIGSNVNIVANTIAYNKAGNEGGGIYISSELDYIFIRNSLITDNSSAIGAEIYLNKGNIFSGGHNFIRNPIYAQIRFQQSDILPTNALPESIIKPDILSGDTSTFTYILLPESPAIGKGEPKRTTDILMDQRGYLRIPGLKADSIDIGASQQHHTTVIPTQNAQFCAMDSNSIILGDIIIADSTGGAWLVDTTKTFTLQFPPQVAIISYSNPEVTFKGSGFRNTSVSIIDNSIVISYQKVYSTDPHFIRIHGLLVQALESGSYELLRSPYGDAIQNGNQFEDRIKHAEIIVLDTELVSGLPYEENFEQSDGGWQNNLNTSMPLWEWKSATGKHIDNSSSSDKVWMVDLENLPSRDTIHTLLYSPCFDISTLQKPMVAFNCQSDIEEGYDGAVLQISTDRGKTWAVVGTNETGINWYHTSSLVNRPGCMNEDNCNEQRYAWTGQDSDWRHAAHRLDKYVDSHDDHKIVRFRFAFISTRYENDIKNYEGFAIDDFFLGDRTRKVLLENFTSTFEDHSRIDSLSNSDNTDIIPLNYHYDTQDEFFQTNYAGPTTRSMYYGRAQAGKSIFGGNDFQGWKSALSYRTIDTSALRPAKFEISTDTAANMPITIIPKKDVTDEIVVYIAVIEQNVLDPNSGKTYHHVLRKFLPNPGGISSISHFDIKEAEPIQISIEDIRWTADAFPKAEIINDYSNLEVVIFIQNQVTKEIYQAEKLAIWHDLLDPELVEKEKAVENIKEVSIYPNPVKNTLFVTGEATELLLVDMQGRQIIKEILPNNMGINQINLSDLSTGVYQVILYKDDSIVAMEKIVVIP